MPAALNYFFGESGYPLPFRTTGCPAAAAAAALIARCALKVLVVEDGITKISLFKILNAQIILECLAHLSTYVTKKLSLMKKILKKSIGSFCPVKNTFLKNAYCLIFFSIV